MQRGNGWFTATLKLFPREQEATCRTQVDSGEEIKGSQTLKPEAP